jgi:acetate kinase
MATTSLSPDQATGDSASPVPVVNSGGSSVKFALLMPQSGERLMAGIGERLGEPAASVT